MSVNRDLTVCTNIQEVVKVWKIVYLPKQLTLVARIGVSTSYFFKSFLSSQHGLIKDPSLISLKNPANMTFFYFEEVIFGFGASVVSLNFFERLLDFSKQHNF